MYPFCVLAAYMYDTITVPLCHEGLGSQLAYEQILYTSNPHQPLDESDMMYCPERVAKLQE